MIVESVYHTSFRDLAEQVDRQPGETWEVDEKRFESLNATQYGTLVKRVGDKAKPKGGRPTKAELKAEAEEKGIEVPEGATNPEIAKLVGKGR